MRKHIVQTLILALPVIIGQLGQVMMGVIDTMMIGSLGYEYVSAVSLANSIFFIIIVLGIGLTYSIAPLIAESMAGGRQEKCRSILQQGARVGIASGILLNIALFISSHFVYKMGQPINDAVNADHFLRVIGFSTTPMLVFLVFKQFTDGLSETVPAMVVTLIGLGANVFFNWILIFGNLGIPALGFIGAAYGTLCARILMAVLMICWVLKSPRYRSFSLRKMWTKYEPVIIKRILQIGIPSGLQNFFEVGAFAGAAIMIGWMGSVERSAHQITISIASATFMVAVGFSAAAAIRVGDAFGRKDIADIRKAGYAALLITFCVECIFSLTFILGKHALPALFNVTDESVLSICARLMIIGAFFQTFDGIQAVGLGILRGLQDVRIPTIVTLLSYWLISLPLAYWLGFTLKLGVDGAWYAFVISLAIAAIAHTLRFRYLTSGSRPERWKKQESAPEKQDL